MTTPPGQRKGEGRTPGPWRVNNLEPNISHGAVIEGASGGHVTDYLTPADAAFIVRACNAHDALLACCECVLALETCDPKPLQIHGLVVMGTDGHLDVSKSSARFAEKLRSAIAGAKKGEA